MRWTWLLLCAGCLLRPASKVQPDAAAPCLKWGPWTDPPSPIDELSRPMVNLTGPWRSSDGVELLYVSDTGGAYKIYRTTLSDGTYLSGTPLPDPVNSTIAHSDRNPVIADDDHTLYFDSDRANPGVASHVYVATRSDPNGVFAEAMDVGPLVPVSMFAPAVTHDQMALFFTATGSTYTVYVATRSSTAEPFGNANPLALPSDSASPSISSDGSELYFVETAHTTPRIAVAPIDAQFMVGNATQVFAGTDKQYDPNISSDGTTLVLSMQNPQTGDDDLYRSTRTCAN